MFPNDANDVFATEVVNTNSAFTGTLVFSVGCHSGLNVPDADAPDVTTGTDWAQAFARRGATFIGNTGYGYGDSDLIAYSERLMLNFTQALSDWSDGPQTVGNALLRAKQRYYNTTAAGSFGSYDEKILAEATLYGLPMLRINMPVTTTTPRAARVGPVSNLPYNRAQAVAVSSYTFNSTFTPNTASVGAYYATQGNQLSVLVGRPIQPLTRTNIALNNMLAHGVVMVGGAFNDIPNFDPAIARIVTEQLYITHTEPTFNASWWYPNLLGSVNRFTGIDGKSHEQLVVVPAQFKANGVTTPTVGTQRLYTNLQFEVYHAPSAETDFVAPSLWQVSALTSSNTLTFSVFTTDDRGTIARVVVLYRSTSSNTWQKVELAYNTSTSIATGSVPLPSGVVEYFAQVVDGAGNVSLALEKGNPFTMMGSAQKVYLPLVVR
jgi:hypothetical protein